MQVPGVAADLRSGGPRAFAPAVVHGVRAVHRKSGRSALDPTLPETAFESDITVVPEERAAFRVKVRHPLDLQDARIRRSVVVEYDPTQPWRVVVPVRAPQQWADRARSLNPSEPEADEIVPRRPGSAVLGLGSLIAAALLGLIQLAG
ncbi:hypothetical protein [Streptomyces sp. NBC_01320]|uniref:hypothetical protein n=1 Tax=Streptomyces sp. NBC_01320 TaxID=2903824 RepID=UPI002E141938|nr:hypothetical protein OG395_16630 [Streptomyces sp. NBC_01320]